MTYLVNFPVTELEGVKRHILAGHDTDILTHATAAAYVLGVFNSADYSDYSSVTITKVADVDTGEDINIDVTFSYVDSGVTHTGVMTVWLEQDGQLYGEW